MIQKTYQHIAAAALLLLLFAGSVQAQTVSAPRMLSYQGVLSSTGTAGNDTAGNRLLKVTLYGDANGTTKLWQSTMNTPVDANGVFNCMLGSADNPLPPPAVMDRAIWLGVSIDNAPELRPLSEVSASAYAINVADSSITTAKIAEGAVTWDKMGTDYVPYIRVNGDKVTTGHNSINFTGSEGMMVDYDSTTMSLIFHPDTALLAGTGGKGGVNTLSVPGTTPWVAGGNVNIGVPTNFVGTNDSSSALEIHLEDGSGGTSTPNNVRIAHYQFETVSPNITMGFGSGSLTGNLIGNAWVHGAPLPHGSTIAGGGEFGAVNTITGNYDLIGEGVSNTVRSNYSALAGGDDNAIDTLADASFLGGGLNNMIEDFGPGVFVGDTIVLGGNVLGGGRNNAIKGALGAIAGGEGNILDSYVNFSFIGAGETNLITGSSVVFSGIVAGSTNIITNSNSIIGAGGFNNITSVGAGIVAGYEDTNNAEYSVIGAGNKNATSASASSSFIGAGTFNYTNAHETFVGAGTSDSVNALESGAVAGQNAKIDSGSFYSIIGAGTYNLIDTVSPSSSIVAGDSSLIGGPENFVGAGHMNAIGVQPPYFVMGAGTFVPSNYSFIGSGIYNFISGSNGSSIVSGSNNEIGIYGAPSPNSIIGAGDSNEIDISTSSVIGGGGGNGMDQSNYSSIGGGYINNASHSSYASIGGGYYNRVSAQDYGTIGGGDSNRAQESYATISGGLQNNVERYYGTIGGGSNNFIYSNYGTVGGGYFNIAGFPTISDTFTVIAGGELNKVSYNWAAITGGANNQASDTAAFIGGGFGNTVSGQYAAIGGGNSNIIHETRGAFIGGGDSNTISDNAPDVYPLFGSSDAFIGGGLKNTILGRYPLTVNDPAFSPYSSIVGGLSDTIWYEDTASTIGGGAFNSIDSVEEYATIGGGIENRIMGFEEIDNVITPNIAPTISGGSGNAIEYTDEAAIGGGRGNTITTAGSNAAIPGGDSLIANSYAQAVVGYNNIETGSTTKIMIHSVNDTALFIVGNGDNAAHPSDAFTVSYSGHSSAYQNITKGLGTNATRIGTMYASNTIEAWGNVAGGASATTDDIGVSSVTHTLLSGIYTIKLNVKNQDGSAHTFTAGDAAITVSLEPAAGVAGGMITVSTLSGTTTPTFTVNTFLPNGTASDSYGFQFHVVAR